MLQLPGTLKSQTFWESLTPQWQPAVLTPEQLRHQRELQFVHSIGLEQISGELSTTQKNQTLHTQSCQTPQALIPTVSKRQPAIKALISRRRRQQPSLQRLLKKAPRLREVMAMADHHRSRLLPAALRQTLGDQACVANQTGALMGPQGPGTDQTGIPPGQGLLQSTPITLATKLSRPSGCRGESAIEADG